jgi:hypothetical protein
MEVSGQLHASDRARRLSSKASVVRPGHQPSWLRLFVVWRHRSWSSPGIYLSIWPEGLRKIAKIVRLAGVQADIWNKHLPNTITERHRYTNMLGIIIISGIIIIIITQII